MLTPEKSQNHQRGFDFEPPNPYKEEFVSYLKTEIGNKAWQFDQDNPHVYVLFASYARQVLAKGRGRFGIAAIWERMRWEMAFSTNDEKFKISNNHRAYYARRLMAENKDFHGFFVTKEARQ